MNRYLLTSCSGTFTCLAAVFTMKRNPGFLFFSTYIPSVLIVIMSWISFWIPPESTPARSLQTLSSIAPLSSSTSWPGSPSGSHQRARQPGHNRHCHHLPLCPHRHHDLDLLLDLTREHASQVIIDIVIPISSVLIDIMTWISFWISPESTPARSL
jgi:hypothetical protein